MTHPALRPIDTICVELTARCPLRCLHCSASASPARTEMLDADALARRLFELRSLEEVYLSGGEPLEYPRLLDVVRLSKRVARNVAVYSSGVVLQAREIAALPSGAIADLASAGVSRIDLSIYAADAAAHEFVTRTRGSYALTLESAARIRAAGIKLGIHFVPAAPGNRLPEVVSLAQRLDASSLHVLALARQGRAQHLPLMPLEPSFLGDLRTLIKDAKTPFELIVSSALRSELGIREPTARDHLRSAFIDVRGYVYPGEGWRLPQLRSPAPLTSRMPFEELLA